MNINWCFSLSILIGLSALACPAIANEAPATYMVRSHKAFSEKPVGTLAYLPFLRKADLGHIRVERNFLIVDDSKGRLFRPKRRSEYAFRLNNSGSPLEAKTFLGVLIIRVHKRGPGVRDSVYVFRQGKWHRGDEDTLSSRPSAVLPMTPKAFGEAHKKDLTLKELDEAMKFRWHGIPEGGGEWTHSFLHKAHWVIEDLLSGGTKFFGGFGKPALVPDSALSVNALLLPFDNSSSVQANNPLYFSFKDNGAEGIFVLTFVPNTDAFNHVLWIRPK